MPQMSPYNWLILFLYFNLIMIFIMTNNHFMLITTLTPKTINMNKLNYNWTW